jgi:hypothetical protein
MSDLNEERMFKVEDISTIGKITIDAVKYPIIEFVLQEDVWYMNNGKKVNQFVFNDLLGLLSQIDVNYIPTTSMTNVIKEDFVKNGIDLKIWDKEGNLIRDMVVGSEIADASGTPFMLRGKSQPFVLRIPGFQGSLRSRIVNKMNEWESNDIYTYDPSDIVSVEVLYHRDESASFRINRKEENFIVTKYGALESTQIPNPKTVQAYLQGYSNIIAEYNDSENSNMEEIKSIPRFATIKVQTKDGSIDTADYYSYSDISVNTEVKSPKDIHPDNKFFADMSNGEFMLVQQRVIWRIFRTYDYFFDN